VTLDEFRQTLGDPSPPTTLTPLLCALWHDARGNWDEAHRAAQDVDSPEGAWVHAYLHRKEGDQANAAYWYRRAQQPIARDSLESEWEGIAQALLECVD
jgi:hypothetical protein